MADATDYVSRAEHDRALQRLDVLEREMKDLAQRVAKELGPAVEDHDDRLDAAELRIEQATVAIADVRQELRRVSAEVTKIVDQQTRVISMLLGQGKSIEALQHASNAQAVVLQQQAGSLELILRNTASIAASLGAK